MKLQCVEEDVAEGESREKMAGEGEGEGGGLVLVPCVTCVYTASRPHDSCQMARTSAYTNIPKHH